MNPGRGEGRRRGGGGLPEVLRQSLGFPSSITGTFLYAAGMPKRGVVGLVADADSDAVEGEGEGEGEEGAAAAGEGGGGEPDREQAGKLKEVAEAEGERHREGDLANPEEGDQKGATDPEDGVEGGGGGRQRARRNGRRQC